MIKRKPALLLAAPLLLGLAATTAYYHDQASADAALARFDRNNPECQLWTNWQRMCSRTGQGGATFCMADPDRAVRPSQPFCISKTGEERARPDLQSLSATQRVSLGRFCSPAAAARGPTGAKVEECGFVRSRPFNGYRLAARLHPWCDEWSDAITREPVCSADGSGGLPQCDALAKQHFVSEHGLSCSKPNVPGWCVRTGGMGTPKESVLLMADRQEGFAVRGIFCDRRK
jgi:hypothetical protein